MTILLMEDDFTLGETIYEILTESGYEVDWVTGGEAASEASYNNSYDLYVFDVNVPEINGFDLVADLHNADDKTPVIFISAMTDIGSISRGFTVGADDYIKKPFYPQELLVRIEARFARKESLFEFGEISYSSHTNEVKRNKKIISLGDVQFSFLCIFIKNIGRTITKETLLDIMEHPSDSALRVAINKLKHTTGWDIINIRGIGYYIDKS